MQGLLNHAAGKFASQGVQAKTGISTAARSSAAFLAGPNKPGHKVSQPRPATRRATHVAATAVVEAPGQAAAPVPLPPPSRKVKKSINDAQYQFKFIVPNSTVGSFLGKGAINVNRVKEETGAYFQFTKPGTAVNSEEERMLILAADSPQQAKQAVELLLDGLASVDGGVNRLRTSPGGKGLYFQVVIPSPCAGNIMGPGGETIKAIGYRTGSNLLVKPKIKHAAFIPFRIVDISSPDIKSLAAAVSEVMDRLVNDDKYAEGIREILSVCVRIIKVPHARVGAILGPGGNHIKALQEMTRVKIGVAEPDVPNPAERFVTLWGSPLNVKVAIDLVLLTTGQLQAELDRRLATDTQSVAEGGEGEEPWTPRSSSAASSASAAFSVQ